jgi:hypothetical protein
MSDNLPLPSARFLTREQSAAYVGVGVTTFDAEVRAGVWLPAMPRGARESLLTWNRRLFDHTADRLGGLIEAYAPGNDLAAAEQAALEASRCTPTRANSPGQRRL